MRRTLFAIFASLAGSIVLPASELPDNRPSQSDVKFFESEVRPLLVKHCYRCHSAESAPPRGDLRLDSRDGLLTGGSRGPSIVPGEPEKSLILKAISHQDANFKMPPREKLPDSAIATLHEWVRRGAPDPRNDSGSPSAGEAVSRSDREFWAYQPLQVVKLPTVRDEHWPRADLDRFILDRLEQESLPPSADAETGTLLRRLHFDLVGLPPSPADTANFLRLVAESDLDSALANECDRLLSTPQFGERWGRHWLDVARFGESSGKEANISFPYAWRYRNYVIDSVQADLPFDRFLIEQIAGDLLPHDSPHERARLLIATGFLAVGTKNLSEMSAEQFQADLVDEQIDSVTRAVLASSIACARCHDHKSDPFSMRDYYALAGIFYSTKTHFGTAVSPSSNQAGDLLPLPREAGLPIFHKSIPASEVQKMQEQLVALRKEQEEKTAAVWKAVAAGEDPSEIFTIGDALRILWTTGRLEGELEKVDEQGQALPLTMGTLEAAAITDSPLLERGEIGHAGAVIPRGFPVSLPGSDQFSIPADQSGRLELATWLTRADHPLTGRVFVNRVWKHLMGTGLVRTVDDFGKTGESPSHPELLDFLTAEFMRDGWSLKKLVRTIVLSRTYRQSSTWNEVAFLKDPENRLLWRMPKRRLQAEAIRDAMLAASGELDLNRPVGSLVGITIGDRPISLIGLDARLPQDLDGSVHRSVYLPVIRDRLPDVLELFDFAEPSLVTGDRESTNVPVQALYLMNSDFVRDRAVAMARRVNADSDGKAGRVKLAFQIAVGRQPDEHELERGVAFLSAPIAEGDQRQGKSRIIDFCQALLATAEFRCVD